MANRANVRFLLEADIPFMQLSSLNPEYLSFIFKQIIQVLTLMDKGLSFSVLCEYDQNKLEMILHCTDTLLILLEEQKCKEDMPNEAKILFQLVLDKRLLEMKQSGYCFDLPTEPDPNKLILILGWREEALLLFKEGVSFENLISLEEIKLKYFLIYAQEVLSFLKTGLSFKELSLIKYDHLFTLLMYPQNTLNLIKEGITLEELTSLKLCINFIKSSETVIKFLKEGITFKELIFLEEIHWTTLLVHSEATIVFFKAGLSFKELSLIKYDHLSTLLMYPQHTLNLIKEGITLEELTSLKLSINFVHNSETVINFLKEGITFKELIFLADIQKLDILIRHSENVIKLLKNRSILKELIKLDKDKLYLLLSGNNLLSLRNKAHIPFEKLVTLSYSSFSWFNLYDEAVIQAIESGISFEDLVSMEQVNFLRFMTFLAKFPEIWTALKQKGKHLELILFLDKEQFSILLKCEEKILLDLLNKFSLEKLIGLDKEVLIKLIDNLTFLSNSSQYLLTT